MRGTGANAAGPPGLTSAPRGPIPASRVTVKRLTQHTRAETTVPHGRRLTLDFGPENGDPAPAPAAGGTKRKG